MLKFLERLTLLLAILILPGCTVHKTIHMTSEPSGLRVRKGGAVACVTPCALSVGAGDAMNCTASFWSFVIAIEDKNGAVAEQRVINPCDLLDGWAIHFKVNSSAPVSDRADDLSFGTAFAVTERIAVTANHVVGNRSSITLVSSTGGRYKADVAMRDSANDVALLRLRETTTFSHYLQLESHPMKHG